MTQYIRDYYDRAETIIKDFENSIAVGATYSTESAYAAGTIADCIYDMLSDEDWMPYEVESIGLNVRISVPEWREDE